MAFFNGNPALPASTSLDPPAIKRQRTDNGYNSTSNSTQNTGAYNSENDSGDELFGDYVPATPGTQYQTQPTQILDRSNPPPPASSPPQTPRHVVQVPASSPFTGRDIANANPAQNAFYKPVHNAVPPRINVAMSMAPAGTAYRPPMGIVSKPAPAYMTIEDDEDDGPRFQGGGSSDDDNMASANIKHTTFESKSANGSFGASPSRDLPPNGNLKFMSTVQNAYYRPQQQLQMRPERARPVEDLSVDGLGDTRMRQNINRIRMILPQIYSVLMIKNALIQTKGSMDEAVALLLGEAKPRFSPTPPQQQQRFSPQPLQQLPPRNTSQKLAPIDLTADEPKMVQVPVPEMKRMLAQPAKSIRDKYSSTQTLAPRPIISTPPQPKRRLVKGRRQPSSPAGPAVDSPVRPCSPAMDEYDSDSGVASASEEDPELEGRVLSYLNKCSVTDLIELTNIKKDVAEIMVNARPFKSINAARCVENSKPLKSGKKSARAPIGDRIVDTAMEMFQGYEAIDTLVARCRDIGKPLADEMAKWGFDVFGQKNGELEMTSFEDNDSQRDSGIGSPTSGSASNNGEDDVKAAPRRRANVQFLKKPEMMAESCTLKDYQIVGLNWLALMYRKQLSGILADEMGLGKTCQVISFLTHLIETGHHGPHLVVCPASTLENWLREFQKFSPQLQVEPYHGSQKERVEMSETILENRDQVNVVVTTYEMAANKNDNKFMRKLRADCCVYDEGHMLKNVKSQRYQGLIRIPANFRLLLTGTPLQNNLQELAALLAFILPDVFKELEDDLTYIFKAKATTTDSNHAALLSAQRIDRARSMLTPFVLRRKKDQVMKDLPAKTGRVEYCVMTKAQKEIYDGHLEQARERARIALEGGKAPKIEENNSIMQLRKAAISHLLFRRHFDDAKVEKMCDILRKKAPEYFDPTQKRVHLITEMRAMSDYKFHIWCLQYPCIKSFDIPDNSWMDSGKIESMIKLVKGYKENGDRVLIFSQFTLVLDILEAVLNTSLISFTRIDGSTSINERQSLIDTYTEDESITAFLLTTKAGGTGINLMCANKVIIFDGSFNPQDDRQAENRAHRVGQVRPVEVVRLVTRGTIEEQIYALGQSKLLLDGRVAGDDAGEEAGEKAVMKMLLEGNGLSGDEEPKEEKKEDVEEEQVPGDDKKLPPRKKSIISMLTNRKKRKSPSGQEDDEKLKVIGEDGEEMLV